MIEPRYPCSICLRNVGTNSIQCDLCNMWVHRKCAKLSNSELNAVSLCDLPWFCQICILDTFPFANLENDEFDCLLTFNISAELHWIYEKCANLNFKPFIINEHNLCDHDKDIDPDNNFYNHVNLDCRYFTDEQFECKYSPTAELSMIHFNARRFSANFHKIEQYLNSLSFKFDVIAMSETWLQEDSCDFALDGYSVYCKSRVGNSNSGGVAIFVRNSLKHHALDNLSFIIESGNIQCVSVAINLNSNDNKYVIITCMYRSPGSDLKVFRGSLENLISKVNNKDWFVCGDFNLDLFKYDDHEDTKDCVDAFFSAGLFPLITRPTRITLTSATLIDNIYTTLIGPICSSGILINDITDHLPIFSVVNYNIENQIKEPFVTASRKIDEISINKFIEDLRNVDWTLTLQEANPNLAYECFLETFLRLYDKNCPVKLVDASKRKREDKGNPWMTNGLKNACKKKNLLYREFLRLRTNKTENKYKIYKNKLTFILRNEEKNYYDKLLKDQINNIKGTWKILNNLIKKGAKSMNLPREFNIADRKITNWDEIAQGFNKFFTNIGPDLARKIPSTPGVDFSKFLTYSNNDSMFLSGVSEEEIKNVVEKFDNKKSAGYDGINMAIVKQVISSILTPLCHICNSSFASGIFPEKMKIARVVPIFKAGDNKLLTNYRPVSLLPQFSKILEKLFNNRLMKFIENYSILFNGQYGFRNNMSTAFALAELVEEITDSMDDSKYTVGIFIDLKKAFDTIDHDILIKKLERYGVRGVVSKWLASYLADRQQYVYVNGKNSDYLTVKCGVPQGSILGPSLFILYINDMHNVSPMLKYILFADDTNLFGSGKDLQILCNTISNELKKLAIWFNVNKLSLNVSKTHYIIFSNKYIAEDVVITLSELELERVESTKFLGVYIDSKFNWKTHIKYIETKIVKNLAVLRRVRFKLHSTSLFTLYSSMILPYLNYCCEIWGNTYMVSLNKLIVIQKKAIRTVGRIPYLDHTLPIFHKFKTMKLLDLIHFKTAIIMYKAQNNMLPVNIQRYFCHVRSLHDHGTRQVDTFSTRYRRTTLKAMCLSNCGVKIWNEMDNKYKTCRTLKKFKKEYKASMIQSYEHQGS